MGRQHIRCFCLSKIEKLTELSKANRRVHQWYLSTHCSEHSCQEWRYHHNYESLFCTFWFLLQQRKFKNTHRTESLDTVLTELGRSPLKLLWERSLNKATIRSMADWNQRYHYHKEILQGWKWVMISKDISYRHWKWITTYIPRKQQFQNVNIQED